MCVCVCMCDLICEKGPLLKHLNKQFCIHTFTIYAQLFITSICFNNGPFHK